MTHALPIAAPAVVSDWMSLARAAGFFLATFALEDLAAVGTGLLLASGGISWPAAFLACFLGIWIGDAGLYAMARYAGRGWFDRSSFRRFSAKVAEGERWFSGRGSSILIFSRVVPGARLPTYLAAGFLRVPLSRFLLLTGFASFFWTLLVLLLAQAFGGRITHWFGTYKQIGWPAVAMILAAAYLSRGVWRVGRARCSARAVPSSQGNRRARSDAPYLSYVRRTWYSFARWRHWEFWPAWMFYPPVAIYCLWLAMKYRGLTLPTAANPGIFSGGIVGESKISILEELRATSPEFTAEAELLAGGSLTERLRSLDDIRTRRDIEFPFILKPDVGQRGVGVKLIRTCEQAEEYLSQTIAPLIVQRYAEGPNELGVFYYRFPHEHHGHIFAITEKIFPKIVGDARHTVAELIQNDPRARFVAATYLKRFAARRDEVLKSGEELKLVEAGNHAQGCIFRDGIRFRTTELEHRIDEISQDLRGFFIGRYDIRFSNEEDLRAGKNFQIIELNGAASEATSIYDSRNSLFDAYRTLFRQWDLAFAIGAENRKRGFGATEVPALWRAWRAYSQIATTYPTAD